MDDTADMNKPNKARGPRSAEDRVKGLLVMLPWLVQERRAVPLTEMAEHFGMSVQHLVKDLELATLCGRPPYTPDQYIELIIDEDTVFASMPRFIENAPALTIAEGLAVLTALKSVQLIPGGASAVATNSLMAKLETVLAPHMEAIDVVISEPEHLAIMNSACDAKESVEIVYFVRQSKYSTIMTTGMCADSIPRPNPNALSELTALKKQSALANAASYSNHLRLRASSSLLEMNH
jgi:hypothetical protein